MGDTKFNSYRGGRRLHGRRFAPDNSDFNAGLLTCKDKRQRSLSLSLSITGYLTYMRNSARYNATSQIIDIQFSFKVELSTLPFSANLLEKIYARN